MPNRQQVSHQKDGLFKKKKPKKTEPQQKRWILKSQDEKRRRKLLLHMSRKQNIISTTGLSGTITLRSLFLVFCFS